MRHRPYAGLSKRDRECDAKAMADYYAQPAFEVLQESSPSPGTSLPQGAGEAHSGKTSVVEPVASGGDGSRPATTESRQEVTPGDGAGLLLAAICARGVTASTLRDAAHEACHAIQWGVKKKWTRDNIHAKKPKRHRLFGDVGVRDEIDARAVEQLVCQSLGVDCGSVEKWADVCWMEMLRNERISLPVGDWLANQIRARMTATRVLRLTAQVMDIATVTK